MGVRKARSPPSRSSWPGLAGHDGGEVSTARAADSPLMFGRMPGTMTAIKRAGRAMTPRMGGRSTMTCEAKRHAGAAAALLLGAAIALYAPLGAAQSAPAVKLGAGTFPSGTAA